MLFSAIDVYRSVEEILAKNCYLLLVAVPPFSTKKTLADSTRRPVFSRSADRTLLHEQVDNLMSLLPGVNVTSVISNAPGVLIRGVTSLPTKVR